MTIVMDLHRKDNFLVLEKNDLRKYLSDTIPAECDLLEYLFHYIDYLNYPLFHNIELDDSEYRELYGWLDGFGYAKQVVVEDDLGKVRIRTGRYRIVLPIPFEI